MLGDVRLSKVALFFGTLVLYRYNASEGEQIEEKLLWPT
jgi:hypothetical protein